MDFLSALRDLGKDGCMSRGSWMSGTFLRRGGDTTLVLHTPSTCSLGGPLLGPISRPAGHWRPHYPDLLATDWELDAADPEPEKPAVSAPASSGLRFVPLVLVDGRAAEVNSLQVSYLVAVSEQNARSGCAADYQQGPVTEVCFAGGGTKWVRGNVEAIARCLCGETDG